MQQRSTSTSTSEERRQLLKSLLNERAKEPRTARLSNEQRRLFTHHRLDPSSSAYNLLNAYRIEGRLDVAALRWSVEQIVRRHEALRTGFVLRNGKPCQVVHERFDVPWTEIDLRGLPRRLRRARAHEIARRETARPFDLASGPVHRLYLLRLEEELHVFLLVVHHIVADVWSFRIFNEELEVLYRSRRRGEPSPLEPLREQYADFAEWQRRHLTEEVLERELDYWERALEGMEVLELPGDHPRPPVQTHRGAVHELHVPERLQTGLANIAREHDVSLFIARLAVFHTLLSRITGRDDVNCGVPVANRPRTESERMIGFFVNTAVLRTSLADDPPFTTLARRLQRTAAGMAKNCHVPFDRLVERLRPQRDSSRNPLFQITFQTGDLPPLELDGVTTTAVFEQDYGIVRSDFEVYVGDEGRVLLVYNRDLYRSDTVEALGRHFLRLWEGIVEDPDRPVGALPLLAPAEWHRVVHELNDTAVHHPGNPTVHELFQARSREAPEAIAAVSEGARISYGELNRRANRLARYLSEQGVGPETPVVLRLDRSLEMLVALVGILKAGGAYVPVSPQQPPKRLDAIVEDCGADLVLTGPGAEEDETETSARGPVVVSLSRLDLSTYPEDDLPVESGDRNLAYIVYTSGSTGKPKGVLVEHRSAVHLDHAMDRLCYRDLDRRTLRASLNAPLDFDASVQQILRLTRGDCLVLVPDEVRLDGPAFVRHLVEQQTEVLDCTPAHLAVLIEAGLLDRADVGLRKILAAGGAIDRRMWDRLAKHPNLDAYDIYGPTECTVNATGQRIRRPGVAPRIGGALENYTVHLLDRAGNPVPNGVAGEIFLGGAGLARGYAARPGLTAESFVPDPFGGSGRRLYRTGDFARRLDDDALEFLGRRDDQVKVRGVRIELGEVRAQLLSDDTVRDAAVLVAGDGDQNRQLVGYVVPDDHRPGTADRIRAALRAKLPAFMIPDRFVVLEELPLTPSGKLDRSALPDPIDDPGGPGLARSHFEQSLLEIWADALEVDLSAIGGTSDFFELGGHSLLATRITSRIRDVLQVEIPPRTLFSHPTPEQLAKVVSERRGARGAALPPVEPYRHTEPAPLSFAQERLWFLDQLDPGLSAYNIPITVSMEGPLDRVALESSIRRFLERHDAMRTLITVRDGGPVQVILPRAELDFPFVDLAGLSAERQEPEVLRLAEEHGARPFRLDRYPLFRFTLVHLGAKRHVLLACLHHILCDAWSIQLMMEELSALYNGSTRLEEPALSYSDYAVWQRRILDEGLLEEHLAFWRDRLDSDPPILNLPMDRPRPPAFRYRGGNVFFTIPPREMSLVSKAAADNGVTVFMFLAGAVQLLLSRYTGQEDVWLGSPVANRSQRELEGLVGSLINMVVLRGDLKRGQTVRHLLRQARQAILDASDHQDLPFEHVVEALNPERSLSYSPLFQCMLTFQSHTGLGLDLEGITTELQQIENSTAKLDLTFDLGYDGDRLEGRLEFNSDIFDRVSAQRLSRGFERLVRQMALRPEAALGDLALCSAAERLQVVREWNDTELRRNDVPCIHQLFERRAAQAPDRVAVVCGGTAVTYGDLNARANRLARTLQSRGWAPRAKIGVFLPRSVEMATAVLAVLKAGSAYVPLDPIYPRDRIRQILRTADVRLVLTDPSFAERLTGLSVKSLHLDDPDAFADRSPDDLPPQAEADDLAYVIFTSGSTGKPKGVVLQHRPVVNVIEWVNETHAVGEGDGLLFITSLCFDLSVYDLFGTLAAGATVHVADDRTVRDPELLVELLYSPEITFWDSAPAALMQIAPLFDRGRGRSSGLRLVFLSGDWIPLSLPSTVTETFPDARVVALGGATEAAIWSNSFPVDRIDPQWSSIPYGRPIRNARYHVLDEGLQPCPINVAGDLYIGGGCLSLGYLDQPVQTALQYIPDPFSTEPGDVLYSTGDRARWRADGNLEFLGRLDAQVKIRGFRIELGEIQAVLESREAVRKAVVLARADGPGDRRLVAYVQPRDGNLDPDDLREELLLHMGSRLPDYMIPGHLVFLDRWPITANGKLDRKALPAPSAEKSGTRASARPESSSQETLARIWADVLGVEDVGIHDNFFSLGGDSILAIQIVGRAKQAGLNLRPRDFFQAQTVAAMLPERSEERAPDAAPVEATAVDTAALTPVQEWFFGRRLDQPHHFNQAVLLEWKEAPNAARLRQALRRLCARHEALRLRFFHSGSERRQRLAPPDAENLLSFVRVDLTELAPHRREPALDACATAIQGSLDIAQGPLMTACIFDTDAGRPPKVLVAVHHLGTDGVSWRILLDDLATLYRDGAAPGTAGSWMEWAGALEAAPPVERFRPELDFWLRQGRRADLPRDVPDGSNVERHAETVVERLSREETDRLERQVPPVYQTRTMDLLVAALVQAFEDGSDTLRLTIDIEGHGRSQELAETDPSRTVGWFTTIHPVALEVAASADQATVLKSVKEQLRAIPRQGIGYGVLRHLDEDAARSLAEVPEPEILFNYLGRFDGALLDNELYRVHPGGAGRDVGAGNERSHLLEINSLIVDGCFETRWRFSRDVFHPPTVERLANRFTAALRAILDHCLSEEAGGRTPSDFPLAQIGQDDLDRLVAQHPDLEDLYPATPIQRGMLFHGELEPETNVYIQQISLEIPGALDSDAFRAACERVIARHPALRTVFWIAGSHCFQVVLSRHRSFWNLEDWHEIPPTEQGERLEQFLEEDLARRFDTAHEVPFRVSLLRLGERRHRLVVTFHHAILDGWSLAILMEEISTLYRARTEERPAELEAAPGVRQYVEWLAERDADEAERCWRAYLAEFREPTPIGRSDTPADTNRSQHTERIVLSSELRSRIERASRELKLTQSTLFYAAWAFLSSRYSNSRDSVVGVTTSGRDQGLPGIERALGLFINTLPLRVSVDDSRSVGSWLREVQEDLAEVRRRDDSSLAEIQEWSELPPGQPLFDSLVVVENYPFQESLVEDWLGLGAEDVRIHERANYPLSLLVELRSEVTLEIKADSRRFDRIAVRRMLRQLELLLEGIAEDGRRNLGSLEILSGAERHRLVVEANDTAKPLRCPPSLPAAVATQASATPERVAVALRDEQLCYAELVNRFERLARHLRNRGVEPGDRVALWLDRSVATIVAILAVQRAGAAHVPLDPELPAERMELLLRDSGAVLVLSRGRADLPAPALELERLDLTGVDPARPLEEVDPAQPAYVIYTSGSTGTPKGVVVNHRAAMNLQGAMQERVYADCGTDTLRLSLNAPFVFDASMQQIVMLGRGHSLHVVPEDVRKDGGAFLDFLARERIEGLDVTPPHLEVLLDAGLLSRPDLSLRRVAVAGGAVRPAVWDRLAASADTRFFNIYGPTECTVNATGRPIERPGAAPSIGKPLANYRAHVLDDTLRPLPTGAPGELFLGGRGLAVGYHERPALTAERFVPDPFAVEAGGRLYRTGDLVRVLERGELEFLRRVDLQVKVRGFRVELQEIESVLRRHPEVVQTIVVAESSSAETTLIAYYTAADGRDLQRATLRSFLRRTLPEYMVPADFVRLEEMPLLPNGKIDRKALPDAGAPGGRKDPPSTSAEEKLVSIWAETLGLELAEVGVEDDFLSLGGHSLNAALLQSRLRDELGIELSLRSLYQGTTIRQAAERLEAEEAALLQSDRARELLDELEDLSEEEIRDLLDDAKDDASDGEPAHAVRRDGERDG